MLYDWEQMMHVDPLNFYGSAAAESRVRGAMLTLWGDILGADLVKNTAHLPRASLSPHIHPRLK
jgi:hypothetical protein